MIGFVIVNLDWVIVELFVIVWCFFLLGWVWFCLFKRLIMLLWFCGINVLELLVVVVMIMNCVLCGLLLWLLIFDDEEMLNENEFFERL